MDDVLARLSRLDACAVSDALDKLGLTGAVSGIRRLSTDRRISGRVVTVKLDHDDGRPAAARHLGTSAIEAAHTGDVIVKLGSYLQPKGVGSYLRTHVGRVPRYDTSKIRRELAQKIQISVCLR